MVERYEKKPPLPYAQGNPLPSFEEKEGKLKKRKRPKKGADDPVSTLSLHNKVDLVFNFLNFGIEHIFYSFQNCFNYDVV